MRKFIALLTKTKEKQLRMIGYMMTLTFFKLYAMYVKKLGQFFYHTKLFETCMFKYISSVESYKYLNKLICIKNSLSFLKSTLYMHSISLIKL